MTETPGDRCLNCGDMLDRAERLHDDKKPEEGDISICLHCGHVMVFTNKLMYRNPTDEELLEIAADSELLEAMQFIKLYNQVIKRT